MRTLNTRRIAALGVVIGAGVYRSATACATTSSTRLHPVAPASPCWSRLLLRYPRWITRLDDLRITSQELTYLAQGARLLALKAHADAEKQQALSIREIFERSERTYIELAAKVERLAELARIVS
jgi:hypothetical protein